MSLTRYRIALFASSCACLPLIDKLHQAQILAGVVLSERQDADALQLRKLLQQAQIKHVTYTAEQEAVVAEHLLNWSVNIGLIFSFPQRLPISFTAAVELSIFNIHASELPLYRGSDPLFWQIKNQHYSSAISIIKIVDELDAGPIVYRHPFELSPLDTHNSLASKLAAQVPIVVEQFLLKLAHGKIEASGQIGVVSDAPAPMRQNCLVDWSIMNANQISALARACNPNLGGAVLYWQGVPISLLEANPSQRPAYGVAPGTILYVGEPYGMLVATVDGSLSLDVISLAEGVFSGKSFAERFGLDAGQVFE